MQNYSQKRKFTFKGEHPFYKTKSLPVMGGNGEKIIIEVFGVHAPAFRCSLWKPAVLGMDLDMDKFPKNLPDV